jgi:hypothetical protein
LIPSQSFSNRTGSGLNISGLGRALALYFGLRKIYTYEPRRRGLCMYIVVSSPPATEETGAMLVRPNPCRVYIGWYLVHT